MRARASGALFVGALALLGCAHHPLSARWVIVDRPAPPDAMSWHNPIEVSLVVEGRKLVVATGAECRIAPGWIGRAVPLSNVHCRFLGPGDLNVGAFTDGDALSVREQSWEPSDGPPDIYEREVARLPVPSGRAVRFEPTRARSRTDARLTGTAP